MRVDTESLELQINELYLYHTARQSQINHQDTPPQKKRELIKLDSEECDKYVELLNL